MALTGRQKNILEIIGEQEAFSISAIKARMDETVSTPTVNRDLAFLVSNNYIQKTGKGRATSYTVSPYYKLFSPLNDQIYFEEDPDSRNARTTFNYKLFPVLEQSRLFTQDEEQQLNSLKKQYQDNISDYPKVLYQKELEILSNRR